MSTSIHVYQMNKKELLKYAESQWPNEMFWKKKLTKQQLLYSVASRTYPEATLNNVALIEDKPYVITHLFGPGHNGSDSSDEEDARREDDENVLNEYAHKMMEFEKWIVKQQMTVIFNRVSAEEEEKNGYPNRYMTVKQIRTRGAATPIILKEIIEKAERTARQMNPQFEIFEPRIIKSDPNLPTQMIHGDNTLIDTIEDASDAKIFGGMVVSCIVAIQDNTKLNIQIGSAIKKVHIPKGCMIMFNAKTPHAGQANKTNDVHYRLHFSMKKPNVKLVDNTITFFQQCEWCRKLYRVGSAITFHRKDCGMRKDAYAMGRKEMRRLAARKHYYKKKGQKLTSETTSLVQGDNLSTNHTSDAAQTLLLLKCKTDALPDI